MCECIRRWRRERGFPKADILSNGCASIPGNRLAYGMMPGMLAKRRRPGSKKATWRVLEDAGARYGETKARSEFKKSGAYPGMTKTRAPRSRMWSANRVARGGVQLTGHCNAGSGCVLSKKVWDASRGARRGGAWRDDVRRIRCCGAICVVVQLVCRCLFLRSRLDVFCMVAWYTCTRIELVGIWRLSVISSVVNQ